MAVVVVRGSPRDRNYCCSCRLRLALAFPLALRFALLGFGSRLADAQADSRSGSDLSCSNAPSIPHFGLRRHQLAW